MAMSTASGPKKQCRNCDAVVSKLAKLVMTYRQGQKHYLSVCGFCYAQLSQHRRIRPARQNSTKWLISNTVPA